MIRAMRATPSGTPMPTPSLTPELLFAGGGLGSAETVAATVDDAVIVEEERVVESEVAMVLEVETVLKTSKSSFKVVPFPGRCWQPTDIAFKSRFRIESSAHFHQGKAEQRTITECLGTRDIGQTLRATAHVCLESVVIIPTI